MNCIYKLIFDKRRNELVVVSEITAGMGKARTVGQVAAPSSGAALRLGRLRPVTALIGALLGVLPVLAYAAPSLPTGGQIISGQGSISSSGNSMTITQGSQKLGANWNTFDIGKGNSVVFIQPNSSAVALNRVIGGGGASQIMGSLTANGQVFLLNPNGVLVGKTGQVNTAGFVASTQSLSDSDFASGNYTLRHAGNGSIINQGNLTSSAGGYVVLSGNQVINQGTITTPSGKAVMAASDSVTLLLDGSGLTGVNVNGTVVNALVKNQGLIVANNGQVQLTARGQDMLLNETVNNSGIIKAQGLSRQGGSIVLDGGDSGVVTQAGTLDVSSTTGQGGRVVVEGQNIHLTTGSHIKATGQTGGGQVNIGGGWQGKDSGIKNADAVVMARGSVIDVSATGKGHGGTAVLWSDNYTSFQGDILARGGATGGNGGQVETSSHNNLQAFGNVDSSAAFGRGGDWLLDPADVTIVGSGASDTNTSNTTTGGANVFNPTADGSQILNSSINNQLNNGTNVTIQTSGIDVPGQWGNITVNADITKTAGGDASLTLDADGNIFIKNQNITSTSNKLNVNLYGAKGTNNSTQGGTVILNHAAIRTNGGDLTMANNNANTAFTVNISNGSVIDTASGNIRIAVGNPGVDLNASGLNVSGSSVHNDNRLFGIQNSSMTGGDINITGYQYDMASSDYAAYVSNSTITATGDLLISGTDNSQLNSSAAAAMIGIVSNSNLSANGKIVINSTGRNTSTTLANINITGSVLNGNSGVSITGGSGFKGIALTNARINSALGDILVNGISKVNSTGTNNGNGAIIVSNTSLNASAGNVTLIGTNANSTAGAAINASSMNINAGKNVTITGTAPGTKSGNYGIDLLNGTNITAGDNVDISMDYTGQSGGYVMHVDNSTVTATRGNVSLVAVAGSTGNANGVVISTGSTVTAGNAITLNGSASGTGQGVSIRQASTLKATNGINVIGRSVSGTGVNIGDATLNAASAVICGSAASGTGFTVLNITRQGGVADIANLSFSSAGSSASVSNTLGDGVLKDWAETEVLMARGIENLTSVNAVGVNINATGDLSKDFSGGKSGGWLLNGASVDVRGNADFFGVSFANGTITVGGNLNITNTGSSINLNNETVTVGGGVSLSAGGGGIGLNGTSITTQAGDIVLAPTEGGVWVLRSQLMAGNNVTIGNFNASGYSNTSVDNSTVTAKNIALSGVGQNNGGGYSYQAIHLLNATLNAANNITISGRSDFTSLSYFNQVIRINNANITAKNLNVTAVANSLRGASAGGGGCLI